MVLQHKILVVDDEHDARDLVKTFLEGKGYFVATAADGVQALSVLDDFEPNLVLLDIRMPNLNGLEALKRIKLRRPQTEVIMVTAVGNLKLAEECLRSGAFGYITKPLDLDYMTKEIQSALEKRKAHIDRKAWEELECLMDKNKTTELKTLLINNDLFNVLKLSFDIIHYSDPDMALHGKNVAWLSREIAEELGSTHLLRAIEVAGLFHDIGKLSFPPRLRKEILKKQDRRARKRDVFIQFPVHGQEMLRPYSSMVVLGVVLKYQCEHVDGSGFPRGLKGDKIPVLSKIIAVANAFDEMLGEDDRKNIQIDVSSSDCDKTLNKIKERTGKTYDATVVDALCKVVARYKRNPKKEAGLPIYQLKNGMILSRDIFTEGGKILFLRNTVLNPTTIKIIEDYNRIDPVISPVFVYQAE